MTKNGSKMTKNGSKMGPKWGPKMTLFGTPYLAHFTPFLPPKMGQNGSKKGPKSDQKVTKNGHFCPFFRHFRPAPALTKVPGSRKNTKMSKWRKSPKWRFSPFSRFYSKPTMKHPGKSQNRQNAPKKTQN